MSKENKKSLLEIAYLFSRRVPEKRVIDLPYDQTWEKAGFQVTQDFERLLKPVLEFAEDGDISTIFRLINATMEPVFEFSKDGEVSTTLGFLIEDVNQVHPLLIAYYKNIPIWNVENNIYYHGGPVGREKAGEIFVSEENFRYYIQNTTSVLKEEYERNPFSWEPAKGEAEPSEPEKAAWEAGKVSLSDIEMKFLNNTQMQVKKSGGKWKTWTFKEIGLNKDFADLLRKGVSKLPPGRARW